MVFLLDPLPVLLRTHNSHFLNLLNAVSISPQVSSGVRSGIITGLRLLLVLWYPTHSKENRHIVSAYLTQFTSTRVLLIIAKITFTFTSLSSVHIYDFHTFTVTYNDFLTSLSKGNETSRKSATNAIWFLLTIHISQNVQTVTHFSIALFRESQNLHTIISELHQTIYFESREVERYGKVMLCLRLSCGSKQNSVTQYHSVRVVLRDWFPAYCN